MSAFVPVILSGGAGARLWPVSREALPKPFIKLPDGESLLVKTLRRALALPDVAEVLTVTNRDYFFLACDEYDTVRSRVPLTFLLEPVGRNTAPAIAAAARVVADRYGFDAQLLILPADQLIQIDCVIIEVQTGDYVGEDDIVRFADHYGRVNEPLETKS